VILRKVSTWSEKHDIVILTEDDFFLIFFNPGLKMLDFSVFKLIILDKKEKLISL